MGFWYYCQEKCCGASAYSFSPGLNQFGGAPYWTYRDRYPLHGNPPAIDAQSDGWVMLRDGYGIRADGSLWGNGFSPDGTARMLFLDPGPWVWVAGGSGSQWGAFPPPGVTFNPGGAGIKADGSMWTWNRVCPGNGDVDYWGQRFAAFSFLNNPLNPPEPVRARIDRKLVGVASLDKQNSDYDQRRFSFSGLKATLYDCEPNASSSSPGVVSWVDIAGGYWPYYARPTSVSSITFDPPGASAEPVFATSGPLIGIKITGGGSYTTRPRIALDGTYYNETTPVLGLDEDAPLTPHISEASIYYVEVTSGGSGYTAPPVVTFLPSVSSPASANAVLTPDGEVSFIRVEYGGKYSVQPTVVITPADGTGGSGCAAVAHVEGDISSVDVTDPGSYTRSGQSYKIQAWSDPPSCAGKVYGVSLAASGSGYFAPDPPIVKITGAGTGAKAEASVDQTFTVTGVTVTAAGSEYFAPAAPLVTFSGGGGTGATAYAFVSEDYQVEAIVVASGGSGYTTPPTVSIATTAEYGTGAVASAVVHDGEVIGVEVTQPGSDYKTLAPPVVSFISDRGSGAKAQAVLASDGSVSSITLTSAGLNYKKPAPPIVTVVSKYGTGAEVKATVDDSGKVSSLYVYRAGSGYDPNEEHASPNVSAQLSFAPPEGGAGSGASGSASVVSRYRHPQNKAVAPDAGGYVYAYVSLRKTIGDAVLSTGGVESVSVSSPQVIQDRSPLQVYAAATPTGKMAGWRVGGEAQGRVMGGGTIGYQGVEGKTSAGETKFETDICGQSMEVSRTFGQVGGGKTATAFMCPEISGVDAPPLGVVRTFFKPADTTVTITTSPYPLCRHPTEQKFHIGPNQCNLPGVGIGYSGGSVSLKTEGKFSEYWATDYNAEPTWHQYCFDFDGDGIDDWCDSYPEWPSTQLIEKKGSEDPEFEYQRFDTGGRFVMTKPGYMEAKVSTLNPGDDPCDVPIGATGPTFEASLKGEWYVQSVSTLTAPGEFRPKTPPLPTLASVEKNGDNVTEPPVLEATLENIDGVAHVTEFAVEEPGSGFETEPAVVYSHNPYWIAFDIKQVGDKTDWKQVECMGDMCVAINDGGELYWWGTVNAYGQTRPEDVAGLYWAQRPGPPVVVPSPVRVGNSAIVKFTKAPEEMNREPGGFPPIEVDAPDTGNNGAGPAASPYGLGYQIAGITGHFSSKYYSTTKFLDKYAFNAKPSLGYLSSPTVTYHSQDDSDPFGVTAELRGPDGKAAAIIPSNDFYWNSFAVLDSDGTVWVWDASTQIFLSPQKDEWVTNYTTGWPPSTVYVATTKDESVGEGFEVTTTECETKRSKAYVISATSTGSGYTKAPSIEITTTSSTIGERPEDDVTPGSLCTDCYNGEIENIEERTVSQQCPEIVTSEGSLACNTSIDRNGCVVFAGVTVGSESPPTTSVVGGEGGSGFSVKVEPLAEASISGGWSKLAESIDRAQLSITRYTNSDISKISGVLLSGGAVKICSGGVYLAGSDFDGISSLSVVGKAAWKEDGTLLVTDASASQVRVQGGLEMKITNTGGGLSLPPKAELADQLPGVATATAKIDGKVVAFGIINRGSGYREPPDVEVDDESGEGSGATGAAHICGPVDSLTVSDGGGGYRVPPLVSFSRPGMPAKGVTYASGGIDGVYITARGSYSSPPTVGFNGNGYGAAAVASIKGYVQSIAVTSQGSGYAQAPEVHFSGGGGQGAAAVAFVSDGKVVGIEVTQHGYGYASPPTVSLESNSGSGATAQATIRGGVDSIQITNSGSGYSYQPDVTFSPGGAAASASLAMSVTGASVTGGGRYWNAPPSVSVSPDYTVESIEITNGGGGYASAPEVLLVGGTGKNATAKCWIYGEIAKINVLAGGSGYSSKFPPYVAISGGIDPVVGKFASASAGVSAFGEIQSISIDDAGSGYMSNPDVSLRWPSTATAEAVIADGKVTAVNVINKGAFYAAAPAVVFSDGSAKATASLQNGSVNSITVDDGGEGYAEAPSVTLAYNTAGAGAILSATINGSVQGYAITSTGAGYRYPPQVLFIGGGGSGASAKASSDAIGGKAKIDATINGGVEYIKLTGKGSGYQFPPAVTIDPPDASWGVQATAQARILGKITSFEIAEGGSGYAETKIGGTLPYPLPTNLPVPAIATIVGVGYRGDGGGFLFGTKDGVVDTAPTVASGGSGGVNDVYVQQPSVVFIDGIGVKAFASLSMHSVGVNHLEAEPTTKVTPIADMDRQQRWVPYAQQYIEERNVWSGSLAAYDSSANFGYSYINLPPLSNNPAPVVIIENESGSGATTKITGDITTGKACFTASGGSGYINRYGIGEPIVTLEGFKPLWLDSPAQATATIDAAGSVSGITVTNTGAGYSAPKVYIHGGGGSGAKAKVSSWGGLYGVAKITLEAGGTGYTTSPAVTVVDEPTGTTILLASNVPATYTGTPNGIPASMSLVTQSTFDSNLIMPISLSLAAGATLAFVDFYSSGTPTDIDSLSNSGRTHTHVFYVNGTVVDARFVHLIEDRMSPAFAQRHEEAPEVVFTAVDGVAPEASVSIVKWHPPVGDGMAIRDTSE